MRRCSLLLFLALLPTPLRAEEKRGLDIQFIDVEGGAATLIVTPAGESVLIDCGNPGTRDAERILKAATAAGIKAIDHLIITHWHSDHYGAVKKLKESLPIHNYYDHGIPDKLDEDKTNFPLLIAAYRTACGGKSKTLRPGNEIKLKQTDGAPSVKLLCLCGNGDVIADKKDAPENPLARDHKPKAEDKTDNAKSLGFLLTYGDFRFLDIGDLTWNIEYKLIAPSDKIGPVDVFQSSHHGLDISNNPVLIKTVKPVVTVFNNGARKGGHPSIIALLRRLPDTKAIYQMHRNLTVGAQENTDPEYIANPDEKCQGESIRLSVAPDTRSYTLTVGSKGKPKTYPTRTTQKKDEKKDKEEPAAFKVRLVGKGRPMILIPGLTCSGEVWDSTVDHFKDRYECHVLTLAGFAGQPPREGPFVEPMRKAIVEYIRSKKLDKPVIVGHSLGGYLVYRLGATEPDLVGPLIAVDGMPCMMALYNEKVDAAQLKKSGEAIRDNFLKQPKAQYETNLKGMVASWVKDPKRAETITKWGLASDRATVTQAIGELFEADARADLSRLKTPLLLLAAHNKEMAGLAGLTRDVLAKRLESQLDKAPKHRIEIADDARHFLMYDAPEWMFKAMDKFLDEK